MYPKFDPKHVRLIKYFHISQSFLLLNQFSLGFFLSCRYLLRLFDSIFRGWKIFLLWTPSLRYRMSAFSHRCYQGTCLNGCNVIINVCSSY
jgi:hypothetical protein